MPCGKYRRQSQKKGRQSEIGMHRSILIRMTTTKAKVLMTCNGICHADLITAPCILHPKRLRCCAHNAFCLCFAAANEGSVAKGEGEGQDADVAPPAKKARVAGKRGAPAVTEVTTAICMHKCK